MRSVRKRVSRSAQRGVGLVSVLAVMALVLASAVAVYVGVVGSSRVSAAQAQALALARADAMVTQFVQEHSRLPCPSSVVDGGEDCTLSHGYLATQTLESGSVAGQPALPALRYQVYRGVASSSDPDLAVATDTYVPVLANGTNVQQLLAGVPAPAVAGAGGGYPAITSSYDICGKLATLSPATADVWDTGSSLQNPALISRAYVNGSSGPLTVAYSLAVAGGANGFGVSSFSQLDAGSAPGMDSPTRQADAVYGDQVQAVSAATLANRLQCAQGLESMDTLANALSLADDVSAQQASDYKSDEFAIQLYGLIVAEDWVFAQVRQLQLEVTTYTNQAAIAAAVVDIASLNFVQAALDGEASGTLSAVWNAIGPESTNFAAQVAASADDTWALAQYQQVAQEVQAANVWQGGIQILKQADITGTSFPVVIP